MKSRDEILRIYQAHFGHSHEAGVFAVFAAGVEDGKTIWADGETELPPEATQTSVPNPIQTSTGSAAVVARPAPVPGKPSLR